MILNKVVRQSICTLGLVLFVFTLLASSQVTDVAQKVSTALTAYGPVPVTTTRQVARTVQVCHQQHYGSCSHGGDCGVNTVCQNQTVFDSVSTTSNAILTASNIQVIKSDPINYGDPIRHELPNQLVVGDYLAENCTSTAATPTFTVSTTFQRSASIGLTHSISHSTTAGMSVSAKLGPIFSATGSISFMDGSSSATVQTDGTTITVQETRSGSQAVPANTFLMIELQTWPVHFTVPFSTNVVIDADLSANNNGKKRLSDILDESQRAFPIAGTIEANDASEGALVFYDLPYNASKCPNGGGTVTGVLGFKPDKKTKLTQRTDSNM